MWLCQDRPSRCLGAVSPIKSAISRKVASLRRLVTLCRQADLVTLTAASPSSARSFGTETEARDSGKKRGNRSIRGGRSTVRAVLYMAAMSVIRVEGVNKIQGSGSGYQHPRLILLPAATLDRLMTTMLPHLAYS